MTPLLPRTSVTSTRIIRSVKELSNALYSVCWAYNWASESGDGLRSGLEYVPMLWSNSPDHTKNWQDDATAAIAAGATHLLGYVTFPRVSCRIFDHDREDSTNPTLVRRPT